MNIKMINILEINNYIFNQLKEEDKSEIINIQSEFINIAKPLLMNRNLNYGNFSKSEKNKVLRQIQKKLNLPEHYIEESSFFGCGLEKDYLTKNENLAYSINISTHFSLIGRIKKDLLDNESVVLNFHKNLSNFDENNFIENLEIDFNKNSNLNKYCFYDKKLNITTTNRQYEKFSNDIIPLAFEHLKTMNVVDFIEMISITKDIDLNESHYCGVLKVIEEYNIDKLKNNSNLKLNKLC